METTKRTSKPAANPLSRRAEFEETGRLEFDAVSPSAQEPSTATTPANETARPPAPDQEKREEEARKQREIKRNWLLGEPKTWVGRRVRCKRNNAVYTVTEIFRTGRVRLERNWMTYLSDVETVRTDYETYC